MKNRASRTSDRKLRFRRSSHPAEGDHNSNWAISYGDMITLLLAFFVLFFSVDARKTEVDNLHLMISEEFNKHLANQDKLISKTVWGASGSKTEGSFAGMQNELAELFEVKSTVQGNKLVVEFPNISFFGSADYKLTPDGTKALQRFAGLFQNFSGRMRLIVRGYTDNRPLKSRSNFFLSDNIELSAFRAISALRVLEKSGIPFHVMRIGGYGESDKSGERSPANVQAQDRKIVLVVEPLDQTERGVPDSQWSRVKQEVPKTGEEQ